MRLADRCVLEANIDVRLHVHGREASCLWAFRDGLLNSALKEVQHALW